MAVKGCVDAPVAPEKQLYLDIMKEQRKLICERYYVRLNQLTNDVQKKKLEQLYFSKENSVLTEVAQVSATLSRLLIKGEITTLIAYNPTMVKLYTLYDEPKRIALIGKIMHDFISEVTIVVNDMSESSLLKDTKPFENNRSRFLANNTINDLLGKVVVQLLIIQEQYTERLKTIDGVPDQKKLESVYFSKEKSVTSNVLRLFISLYHLLFQGSIGTLVEHVPFMVGDLESYDADAKMQLISRIVQQFAVDAMHFVNHLDVKQLWTVDATLDKELYQILAETIMTDWLSKISLQLMVKYQVEDNVIGQERLQTAINEDVLAVNSFRIILNSFLPSSLDALLEFGVFLSEYGSNNINKIAELSEKYGFTDTVQVIMLYLMRAFQKINQDLKQSIARKHEIFNFEAKAVVLNGKVSSKLLYDILWAYRKYEKITTFMLRYFIKNKHCDINEITEYVLRQTGKVDVKLKEIHAHQIGNEDFDSLSKQLANYIKLN